MRKSLPQRIIAATSRRTGALSSKLRPILGGLLLIGLITGFDTPLVAQYYNIVNRLSGRVIDLPTPACTYNNGCQLQQWDSNGSWQQQWQLVPTDSGYFNIVNRLSGKVLDIPTPICTYNNGCQLQQWDSNGGWQQQWQLLPTDSGFVIVVNRLSGKVLDLPTPACTYNDGCQLQQWDSNGGWQQQWEFTAPAGPPPPYCGANVPNSYAALPGPLLAAAPKSVAPALGTSPAASNSALTQLGATKLPGTPAQRRAAFLKTTPEERQAVIDRITPFLQKLQAEAKKNQDPGTLRSWTDILQHPMLSETALKPPSASSQTAGSLVNRSPVTSPGSNFVDENNKPVTFPSTSREYHGPVTKAGVRYGVFGESIESDGDGDGLPDSFENQVADNFRPYYAVSSGESDVFALFNNSPSMSIAAYGGSVPPISHFRVQPLGLTTDSNGTQVYALRIDYMTLWNADGGLIGGGEFCAYSYFGLDQVIQEVSSHPLDTERSAMLVFAPAVNGGYNPDPNAYSLASVYLAAHEGTFFDQSRFADFNPGQVPAGNHLQLFLSLSKHSTYNFNPDFYPIIPGWFIASTNAGLLIEWQDGELTDDEYYWLSFLANDVFYGCATERFFYQGFFDSQLRINVGEPNRPINGCSFIDDNTANSFYIYSKLANPIW